MVGLELTPIDSELLSFSSDLSIVELVSTQLVQRS
jgi:hypothetical protein